ncbi:hypothetical protein ACRCUN_11465 [Mycobacterium sp. LTG2003]
MAIQPYLSAGAALAAAGVLVAVPAITPPLSARDQQVVSQTSTRLSTTDVTLTASNQPLVVDPASLLQGLTLVNQIDAGTTALPQVIPAQDQPAAADNTALVVDDPVDFIGGLLQAYITGGSPKAVAYVALAVSDEVFGEDSLPSVLLDTYVTHGVPGIAGLVLVAASDAIFGPDSVPSQVIEDAFTGGINQVIGNALLGVSDQVFGEDSIPSGLTQAYFIGYPEDDEDAPTGVAGVTRYVIDSLIDAITQSASTPTVSTTGAISLQPSTSSISSGETPSIQGAFKAVAEKVSSAVDETADEVSAGANTRSDEAAKSRTVAEKVGSTVATTVEKVTEKVQNTVESLTPGTQTGEEITPEKTDKPIKDAATPASDKDTEPRGKAKDATSDRQSAADGQTGKTVKKAEDKPDARPKSDKPGSKTSEAGSGGSNTDSKDSD